MSKNKKIIEVEGIELSQDRSNEEKPTITWYPGHMAKALRRVQGKLKMVDIVLEIRDARAPLISGNSRLRKTVGEKRTLIIINKINLADPILNKKWEDWFRKNEENYIFLNCLDKKSVKKIVTLAKEIVEKGKTRTATNKKMRMMFIGLPNTGKSTIINRLAGRSATRTADKPGLTQSQQWINIDSTVELLDTPGIMPPRIKNDHEAFFLCAIHAIKDAIVGEDEVSLFVIKFLLKKKAEALTKRYGIEDFNISPGEALEQIGIHRKCIMKKGIVDYDRVYRLVLSDFRKGELGRWSFEQPPVD